jgi:predicted phosphodiesterase
MLSTFDNFQKKTAAKIQKNLQKNTTKKIQFASDLHIDINTEKAKFLEKEGDILCLVGDICSCGSQKGFDLLKLFLTRECRDFEKVIYVAGNHEFYTDELISMHEIKLKLKISS